MSSDLVLEGREGFLFLSGGSHSPLRFAQDGELAKPESIREFWGNIRRRQAQMKRRAIRYAHLIAPDKHSVCQEVFPVEVRTCLGEKYLEAAPSPALKRWVTYPRDALASDFRSYCYRVDTHYRPPGTLLMIRELLTIAGGNELAEMVPLDTPFQMVTQDAWPGDLGCKLNPPQTERCVRIRLPSTVRRYSNHLAAGNNGIIDLYVNREYFSEYSSKPGLGRVLVSGDSYGRVIAHTLSVISQEVLFVHTPYLHIELVDAMKPDLVLTQNAERYLSGVSSDEQRPVFFLYPFFKQSEYAVSAEMVHALSAVLAYGRPPYDTFCTQMRTHSH